MELYQRPVSEIPIKKFDINVENKVESIINFLIENPLNTVKLSELNLLFYGLYDLTYEEVKVVDPDFKLSEEEYVAIEV